MTDPPAPCPADVPLIDRLMQALATAKGMSLAQTWALFAPAGPTTA